MYDLFCLERSDFEGELFGKKEKVCILFVLEGVYFLMGPLISIS